MNELQHEKPPYLLQHAGNPVSWRTWRQAAFDAAMREDKPIFLYMGYSTCHWCHVMAHESFEDEAVAEALNRVFFRSRWTGRSARTWTPSIWRRALP